MPSQNKSRIIDAGKNNFIPNPIASNHEEVYFNLKDFDRSQGQSFKDWENSSLLSRLMDMMHNYSSKCLYKCNGDNVYCEYGDFPHKKVTEFKEPIHVTKEAKWARFRIGGGIRLVGHRVGSIFYIVFLDKEHEFWKSEKK